MIIINTFFVAINIFIFFRTSNFIVFIFPFKHMHFILCILFMQFVLCDSMYFYFFILRLIQHISFQFFFGLTQQNTYKLSKEDIFVFLAVYLFVFVLTKVVHKGHLSIFYSLHANMN